MLTFSVTVDETTPDGQRKLSGLDAAVSDYNQSQKSMNAAWVDYTREQYIEFVMSSAMDSYANAYLGAPVVAQTNI